MSEDTPSIDRLIESTKKIFNDCSLPNGCLVAAPSHMPYYPKEAKSYLYCWPGRDTGFNLAAMLIIGEDRYEPMLKWVWERAEDFQNSHNPYYLGLIYRSYYPNGLVREHQFQPDQGATLIWSIYFKSQLTNKPISELEANIVNRLAQNYMRVWKGDGFDQSIEDIWEERGLAPGEGIFSYSLAACAKAMEQAAALLKKNEFNEISKNMQDYFMKTFTGHDMDTVPRRAGGTKGVDLTPDGSLSGLVWPFNIGLDDNLLQGTLSKIESELLTYYGVFRYPEDRYEGKASRHLLKRNRKAGAWPLLTFWLSIAKNELGDSKKATEYYSLVFENIDKTDLESTILIPEQLFVEHDHEWEGVKPLLWSHAMAILAAWKLGLIKTPWGGDSIE